LGHLELELAVAIRSETKTQNEECYNTTLHIFARQERAQEQQMECLLHQVCVCASAPTCSNVCTRTQGLYIEAAPRKCLRISAVQLYKNWRSTAGQPPSFLQANAAIEKKTNY
jgi:hypothetical protein